MLQAAESRLATLMSHLPGMAYRCKNDANSTMEKTNPQKTNAGISSKR